MENKINLKKCPLYKQGKAEKKEFLNNELIFCYAEVCPYNKEITTTLSEGKEITICKEHGLLKRIELQNPDTNKKSNNPKVYPTSDLPLGNLNKINYLGV